MTNPQLRAVDQSEQMGTPIPESLAKGSTLNSGDCEGTRTRPINRNNLDFCRFWLAILVIFSHSFALTQGDELNEPMYIATSGQLDAGQCALGCFFAISGFLITHSWLHKSSVVSFFSKRILRIYPGFIVAVLIGLFVVTPLASSNFAPTWRNLLLLPVNLLALRRFDESQAFVSNPLPGAVNGSLWSIPYEFRCYLGLMLLGWIGLLTIHKRMTLVLLVLTVTASTVYPLLDLPILELGLFAGIIGQASAWSSVSPYFLAGIAFYLYWNCIPFTAPTIATAIIALAVASVLPPAGHVVFPFAITYVLFWCAFHPALRWQAWSRHGDFSYGIYLYAFPIQQLITMRIPALSPIMLFAIATPLSIIAGIISWHLIERHFVKAARSYPALESWLIETQQAVFSRMVTPASTKAHL